jgi:SAM-dependent methyltransferase
VTILLQDMGIDDGQIVIREYDTLDPLALRRLDRTGWLRFDDLDEEQTLVRAVAEVHPTRVLDVGCGDGRLASLYAAPEVECLDGQLGDAGELPFAAGSFDVVTCNYLLCHLPDPDHALQEFVRVLRPGGRFAGIYNAPEHLREVFGEVEPEAFDSESGLPLLQARFASVSRLHRGGSVLWLTQRDLQRYLDAFTELYGPLRAPDGPYPFTATRAKCVFVADAA